MPPIEIKTAGIDKLISELDEHKACGPDGIRPIVLKRLRASTSPTLQCIFSKSLAEGQVPDDWKHANVTPLHKKGNRNDPANYRPISLTCVCCKLMEHIVVSNFMRHLEASHILNPNQHGFRKGLSCETQLVEFSHALLTNMHIGHQTDIIILDFAKAFDKVNHNKLIHKLKAHRVDMLTVEWIEAFLSNRSQIVVLDGTSSDSVPVTSGVPQGSVLGPALFLLYINDLPDTIDSQVRLFADDTVLYRTIKSDTDHHRLQTDLDKLSDWANAWDMQFHTDKCLVMNISKKRHPSKFTYSLHNTDLKTTDTAKYLGIIISQDMKWTKHITQTCSHANRALGFIKINVKIRSPLIKEKLYNSLVRPHVEYASAVWSPHEVKPIHQLEMVQRRAARLTLNRHHNTSSVKGMLEDLQWRALEQRRADCRLVLLFQILHGLVQIPPTNYLQLSLNTTSRKNHNYTYQQCSTRTNYFKYSFFPYTTVIWNNLPYQLVNPPPSVIYTNKIDGVVCPPNISETVAGRLMKLAHRQRIASTTIKLISKKITVHFINFSKKTIRRIVADPGSGKTIQQIIIYLYESRCCPNHVPLGQVPTVGTIHTVPSHALNSSLLYTRASCTVSTSSAKDLCNTSMMRLLANAS